MDETPEKKHKQKPRYKKNDNQKQKERNRKQKEKNQKLRKAFEPRVSSLDLGLSLRILRNQRIDLSLGVERSVSGNSGKFLEIFPNFGHRKW